MMHARFTRTFVAAALAAVLVGGGIIGRPSDEARSATPYQVGQVFAGVGSGQVKVFEPDGTLVQTLNNTTGSTEQTGMAFDTAGNLYTTNFSNSTMSKFDNAGNLLAANFGSGFNAHPESVAIDASGNLYVGQADGSADVLKFDSGGNLLDSYNVALDARGSDWIDLAADQCTLLYTGEGSLVKQYNVCTDTQLPDFATGLPGPCFAVRILSDGGAIVACFSAIQRLDSGGNVVQTYDATGENLWFAANLDADGTTFWSGNISTGQVYRFNIETGAELTNFATSPFTSMAGLAVFGEIRAAQPNGGAEEEEEEEETDCLPGVPGLPCGDQAGGGDPSNNQPLATPEGATPVPTVVPPTPVPAVPTATATAPGGGRAGTITAPDTGTGDGTAGAGGGAAWLLVAVAGAAGLVGGGAVLAGRRVRR